MDEFDYIVVGAGSSGCVLAARLAERPQTKVCLLEAGPKDSHPLIHIPVGWIKLMKNHRLNWLYSAEASEWTGGRRIPVPRGKTLGGSSSINGNVYNRGAPSDFDYWAQLGNTGWGYADVLPLFKKIEDWKGPNPDNLRGRAGKLTVTPSTWNHPLCDAFIRAAESLGIPRNPDYNGAAQFGVAYAQRSIANGRRQSASVAYLRPVMRQNNLNIRTGSEVTELLFENAKAIGVRYRRKGHSVTVKARREIILSGGVINSPKMLELAGIGAPDHLASLGIRVRAEVPGVGENLRDHYTPRFTARVKNSHTFNERVRGLAFWSETAKWLTGYPSVLGLPSTVCYAFAKSSPVLDESDLQVTFMPASYKEGQQSQLDSLPGMTFAAWQQRPESKGCVHIRSAGPRDAPEIRPNYLSAETDRRVLLAGLKLVRKLMRADAMKPYFDSELYPGDAVQSDEDLLHCARERGTTTFHMVGTCKMGPDQDAKAVVDPRLRVRGVEGLRVADASIMPTLPASNTNAAALMIGEKAAELIQSGL